jgi:type II secretory pathway component PulC
VGEVSQNHAWLRRGLASIFMALAIFLSWKLIQPLVSPVQSIPSPAAAVAGAAPDAEQLAVEIEAAHIFGAGTADISPQRAASAIKNIVLEGILYAETPDQSFAALQVDGVPVVAQTGSILSDDEKVTQILTDRIELEGPDGIREVMLDIKQASTDQRLASLPLDGSAADPDLVDSSPVPAAPVFVPVRGPVQRVPVHFRPLAELRGSKAAPHFGAVKPP